MSFASQQTRFNSNFSNFNPTVWQILTRARRAHLNQTVSGFSRYPTHLGSFKLFRKSPGRRFLCGHQSSVCPRRRLSANGSACLAAAALSALLPPPKPDCCITSTRPRGTLGWGVAPRRRPIAECSRDRARCMEMFRF